MFKFTDKVKLIKESNFKSIDDLCYNYDMDKTKVDNEYKPKFINAIDKILRLYEKYVQDDISFINNGDDFHIDDIVLHEIEFENGQINILGTKYVGDKEYEISVILQDIDVDFASSFLRNLSHRDYIMKYLSYDSVKKINNG